MVVHRNGHLSHKIGNVLRSLFVGLREGYVACTPGERGRRYTLGNVECCGLRQYSCSAL